jgi:2-dehydro-3-deoxyphosphogluconate aldolase / (4S)-4-hydroxy-2-oxoglutarate aldolase
MDMRAIIGLSPVIPVVTIADAADAAPMARALIAGGLKSVEITLRTPAALDAIRRVAAEVPELAVGAGTILNCEDLQAAHEAGAGFFVSPGLTEALLIEASARGMPYLPGVMTAAEIMAALDHGFDCLKFFPAAPSGVEAVKSFAGPFPHVSFCTTGGIGRDNAAAFLALPNVLAVGASWVASEALLAAKDWAAIEANARFAAGLAAG